MIAALDHAGLRPLARDQSPLPRGVCLWELRCPPANCRHTPARYTRGHLVEERPVCLRLQDLVCSAPLQCVQRDREAPEKLHESHPEQVPSFPDSIGRPDRVNGRESSSLSPTKSHWIQLRDQNVSEIGSRILRLKG